MEDGLVPEFTPASWVTAWTWSWPGIAVAFVLAVPYVVLVSRARRLGHHWPIWRTAVYLVAGVGSLIYVTCGAIGSYRTTFLWCFGAEVGVIATITPLALALGDPVGLAQLLRPGSLRILQGRIARVLMFPLFASVLSAASIFLIFFTPYALWAITTQIGEFVLLLHLLIVGMLVVLPLLTKELLPAWATAPVKTVFAFADGLFDAIPGILVMTSSTLLIPNFPGFASSRHAGFGTLLDQKFTGGALLGVAEAIGVPLLAVVFVQWLRSDAAEAAEIDARLDDLEQLANSRTTASPDAGNTPAVDAGSPDRPWWLDDPRFADRYGRGGDQGTD